METFCETLCNSNGITVLFFSKRYWDKIYLQQNILFFYMCNLMSFDRSKSHLSFMVSMFCYLSMKSLPTLTCEDFFLRLLEVSTFRSINHLELKGSETCKGKNKEQWVKTSNLCCNETWGHWCPHLQSHHQTVICLAKALFVLRWVPRYGVIRHCHFNMN